MIEIATSTLYDGANGLYSLATTGISAISGSFTETGFKAVNGEWKAAIDTAWEENIKKDIFDNNGELRQGFLDAISEKYINEMSMSEREKYGLLIARILSDKLTDEGMNRIVDAYPTANTDELIKRINEELDDKNKITKEEATRDPKTVSDKLKTIDDLAGTVQRIRDDMAIEKSKQ